VANLPPLSAARKAELDALCRDPTKRPILHKMAAFWKGASFRNRAYLSNVLDRLQDSHLRGTLIYAHGSGGCSWDNIRICRMIAGMNFLVIAPDGFASPKSTAMGQMRHKDLQPLKKVTDGVDYWADDLLYASDASGGMTYSTKAETVLDDPDKWRELYEKCYQLRRSELHFIIKTLPGWIKTKGFFIGGTSEGAMTVARFDDQRYGSMVMGRFINSFSVEYCYFTPNPRDGEIGGQTTVPTLNIIGTKDQFFGSEDSVAKIVAADTSGHGYGNASMRGHGYETFKRQGMEDACVVYLEGGVHSPCLSHDNFLRQVFDVFFSRPADIDKLDMIWSVDPKMAELVQLNETTRNDGSPTSVTLLFVPKMEFPQTMPLKEVRVKKLISKADDELKKEMDTYEAVLKKQQDEATSMLDGVRAKVAQYAYEQPKSNYYSDKTQKSKKEHQGKSAKVDMTKPKPKPPEDHGEPQTEASSKPAAKPAVQSSPIATKPTVQSSPVPTKPAVQSSPVPTKPTVQSSPVSTKPAVLSSPVPTKTAVQPSPVSSSTSARSQPTPVSSSNSARSPTPVSSSKPVPMPAVQTSPMTKSIAQAPVHPSMISGSKAVPKAAVQPSPIVNGSIRHLS
jgi:hypothetical protein